MSTSRVPSSLGSFCLCLVLCFLSLTGCTQKCGTCKTIDKNESLVDRWISDVAKRFEGAKYNPGNPSTGTAPTVTFQPQSGGFLASAAAAAGGIFSVNGAKLAKEQIAEQITCEAEASDGELCATCPKKPKIIFNCGQACEEDSVDCSDKADECFKGLLSAAISGGYNPRTNNYSSARVRQAMNKELAQNPSCAALKGFHSKCEAPHTSACDAAKEDPAKLPQGDQTTGGGEGQIGIEEIRILSTGY